MAVDAVRALLQQCVAAREAGMSFPDVWHRILQKHPLVAGRLRQGHRNGGPVMEVPLITGARLVHGEDGYSLE